MTETRLCPPDSGCLPVPLGPMRGQYSGPWGGGRPRPASGPRFSRFSPELSPCEWISYHAGSMLSLVGL